MDIEKGNKFLLELKPFWSYNPDSLWLLIFADKAVEIDFYRSLFGNEIRSVCNLCKPWRMVCSFNNIRKQLKKEIEEII